jgi:zinc-finger of transposase IS204/IS1001/IS1096/IS1165
MLDVIPLVIRCLRLANGQLLLEAEGARERVPCPSCAAESDQVHGHYQRSPLDLPWRGQPVRVSLRVRRFRCLVPECERQTFAEAFPGLAPRKARRTAAATTFLIDVAKQLGGEAGARVARAAGLPVSPDTLLRILRDGDALSSLGAAGSGRGRLRLPPAPSVRNHPHRPGDPSSRGSAR